MEAKILDRVYWSYDEDESLSGFVVGKIAASATVQLDFVDLFNRTEQLVPVTVYLVTVEERLLRNPTHGRNSAKVAMPIGKDCIGDIPSAISSQIRHVGDLFQQRFFRVTSGMGVPSEGLRTISPEIITKVEEATIEEFYTSKIPLTVFLGRYKTMVTVLKDLAGHLDAPDFVEQIEKSLAIFPNKVASIMAIVNAVQGNREKLAAVNRAIELLY
jgi:hypothetical protein